MNKIKYIVHYDTPDSSEKRNTSPATVTKVDYILKVLDRLGVKTEVVSASDTVCGERYPESMTQIGQNVVLKKFKTLCRGNKILNVISRSVFKIRFYNYLLKNVKDGDVVFAYHSLALIWILKCLKRLRNIRLILEVEEIYGDVKENKKISKKELRFFKLADAYIFPTELLNEKINKDSKPFAIVYGTYNINTSQIEKFSDGKTHCVYAGTLDPNKGGASMAVSAGEHLNDKFVIHILGFGTQEQIDKINKEIEIANNKDGAKVIYEGVLKGADYDNFLKKCDIGLSTQISSASFNDTSFPSKVLTYLSNGLTVISGKIAVLTTSKLNELICYYDDNEGKSISKAIEMASLKNTDNSADVLKKLDEEFSREIEGMLKER